MTTTNPTRRPVPAGRVSPRRAVAALALAVVAAGAGTLASVALAGPPLTAQADPGDTVVPIGTSRLVQSEDLTSIQLPLDTAAVVLGRDDDFSSCLGEGNPWTSVLPGSAAPIAVTWTQRGHRSRSVSEDIAQAATPAQAAQWAKTLVDESIRACRKPVYDSHYGPLQTARVGSGSATWALSYRGRQQTPDGGVVVVQKGDSVGFLQVNGTWGPSAQTLESVAKVATDRLG